MKSFMATGVRTRAAGRMARLLNLAPAALLLSGLFTVWTGPLAEPVAAAQPPAYLAVSPSNTTIAAGSSQSYTAQGFDAYGNALGDVTAVTTFTSDGGPCTGSSCMGFSAGSHFVMATDGSAFGYTSVTVTAGPLAHLDLSPYNLYSPTTIVAGGSQTYTATASDAYGNNLGDVTAATTFALTGGSCAGSTCTSTAAGNQTVTATDGGVTASATLVVTPGPAVS